MRNLRPLQPFLTLYEKPRAYEFKAETLEEWEVWRERLKKIN